MHRDAAGRLKDVRGIWVKVCEIYRTTIDTNLRVPQSPVLLESHDFLGYECSAPKLDRLTCPTGKRYIGDNTG
ncbi:hypothetical protein SPAN111604_14360 [Sphingomonas antarctica]